MQHEHQLKNNSAKNKNKQGFFAFINQRFGIETLNYEVPVHANTLPFTLGGITAISTLLTIVTGILLTFWYVPTPEEANLSIRYIMSTAYLGSVIRGIHFWAAQATVVALVLHLLRVMFYGSYKFPREGNWIIGVFLFITMIGLYFTGTMLKWDQEGFEALEHAVAIADTVGLGGFFAAGNASTLIRFFTLHISLLPLLLLALLFIHMLLVKRMKISPLPWQKDKKATNERSETHDSKKHTFLHHIGSLIGYGYIVSGIIIILALLVPPVIGPEPITGIEVTKPFWTFLWLYAIEEWFGINGAWIIGGIPFLALLALPFIDRAKTQAFRDRKGILTIAIIVTITILALTFYAYFSSPVVHLDM